MILACSFEMTNSFFLLEKNLHGGKGVSLRVPDSPQRVKTTTPRKMATTTIAERLQQPCETRLIAGTSMFQQTIRNTTALQCLTLRSIHPIESFQLAFRLPIDPYCTKKPFLPLILVCYWCRRHLIQLLIHFTTHIARISIFNHVFESSTGNSQHPQSFTHVYTLPL